MKILLERTSDWNYKEIKEYDGLESCVDEILSNSGLFPNNCPEVVVTKCDSKELPDVSYIVEIYDAYRE